MQLIVVIKEDSQARFGAADAKPKPFDLVHPTKGKGHRLRYACIEGPEVGVYYRGRLKESNVITFTLLLERFGSC